MTRRPSTLPGATRFILERPARTFGSVVTVTGGTVGATVVVRKRGFGRQRGIEFGVVVPAESSLPLSLGGCWSSRGLVPGRGAYANAPSWSALNSSAAYASVSPARFAHALKKVLLGLAPGLSSTRFRYPRVGTRRTDRSSTPKEISERPTAATIRRIIAKRYRAPDRRLKSRANSRFTKNHTTSRAPPRSPHPAVWQLFRSRTTNPPNGRRPQVRETSTDRVRDRPRLAAE